MLKKLFAITVIVLMFTGCATIKHGTNQIVPIDSSPSGAKVYVDGEYQGDTPLEIKLSRSHRHRVGLSMGGHELGLYEFTPTFSYDVLYNFALLPGVFAGFLVDSLTGGLYDLSLDAIDHQMVKQETIPQVR